MTTPLKVSVHNGYHMRADEKQNPQGLVPPDQILEPLLGRCHQVLLWQGHARAMVVIAPGGYAAARAHIQSS